MSTPATSEVKSILKPAKICNQSLPQLLISPFDIDFTENSASTSSYPSLINLISGYGSGKGYIWAGGASGAQRDSINIGYNVYHGSDGNPVIPNNGYKTLYTRYYAGGEITNFISSESGVAPSQISVLTFAGLTMAADKYIKITGSAAFPANPTAGTLYYKTDSNTLHLHNGTNWVTVQVA